MFECDGVVLRLNVTLVFECHGVVSGMNVKFVFECDGLVNVGCTSHWYNLSVTV